MTIRQHVRTLAWLHIGHSILVLAAAALVFGVLDGVAGLLRLLGVEENIDAIATIVSSVGLVVFGFAAILSLPKIGAALGLFTFQSWARTLMIAVSLLSMLDMPVGMVLGVYGLWILLSAEGTALFRQ